MIHINLLPFRAVEEASSRRRELKLVAGFIALALIGAISTYFFQSMRLHAAHAERARLENTIEKIRKQYRELEKMELQKKDIEEKIQVVARLTNPERRTASVRILDDLSSSTPENLWLTEFSETSGAAKINGKAVDNQTIAAFAHNLSKSQYFQKVEIRETAQESFTPGPRKTTGRGKIASSDAPETISLTRFLIEADINYLSPDERLDARENRKEEVKTGIGKSPKKNKAAGER